MIRKLDFSHFQSVDTAPSQVVSESRGEGRCSCTLAFLVLLVTYVY